MGVGDTFQLATPTRAGKRHLRGIDPQMQTFTMHMTGAINFIYSQHNISDPFHMIRAVVVREGLYILI